MGWQGGVRGGGRQHGLLLPVLGGFCWVARGTLRMLMHAAAARCYMWAGVSEANWQWLSITQTRPPCWLPTHLSQQVITCADYHPQHCNVFAYSSSKGLIRLADQRAAALCDQHAKLFEDAEPSVGGLAGGGLVGGG